MTYPGGKGKCYRRLINMMPPHTTYIESHLGSGAVLRHKRPAQINIGIDADESVLVRWRDLYPANCILAHRDAAAFLQEYPYAGGELIYADPPYLVETRRKSKIYKLDYTDEDHDRLLDVLISVPCYVMLSGYDNPMYRKRLSGWRTETFQAKTQVGLREECVWMNYPKPKELHDSSAIGATFRERQSFRRRQQRMLNRFDCMESSERSHLLHLLNARYCKGTSTS